MMTSLRKTVEPRTLKYYTKYMEATLVCAESELVPCYPLDHLSWNAPAVVCVTLPCTSCGVCYTAGYQLRFVLHCRIPAVVCVTLPYTSCGVWHSAVYQLWCVSRCRVPAVIYIYIVYVYVVMIFFY